MNALIVLSHGSRSPESRTEFEALVAAMRFRFPSTPLHAAYMELCEPSLPEVVDAAVAQGATRIVVAPCFLFHGNHIKRDIPDILAGCHAKHPQVEFLLGRHVGIDPLLAELLSNRILECLEPERLSGADIEVRSFAIIDSLLAQGVWSPTEHAVITRLVHTAGDPTLATEVVFTAGAAAAGVEALQRGCHIVTDVKMVAAGLNRPNLSRHTIFCAIEESPDHPEGSRTRAEAGMRQLAEHLDGSIVAIGNAPTALRTLLELVGTHGRRPALVVGMPVGFVDAAESKEALLASGLPAIVIRGNRGGSPFAAATVNALAKSGS